MKLADQLRSVPGEQGYRACVARLLTNNVSQREVKELLAVAHAAKAVLDTKVPLDRSLADLSLAMKTLDRSYRAE